MSTEMVTIRIKADRSAITIEEDGTIIVVSKAKTKKDFSDFDMTRATPLGKKMLREADALCQKLKKEEA